MQVIAELLTPDEVARIRAIIAAGPWEAGAATAGHLAQRAKANAQLAAASPAAADAGAIVRAALDRSPAFLAAALPRTVLPPLFSRYAPGEAYGPHVDNALRRSGSGWVRTDLSVTLFLSPPESYEGGALLIADGAASHRVKLPAGTAILYPADTIHQVEPVGAGERLAAVIWVESLVGDAAARRILLELDGAVQQLGDHPSALRLTGIYHNLLRRWAGSRAP